MSTFQNMGDRVSSRKMKGKLYLPAQYGETLVSLGGKTNEPDFEPILEKLVQG